MLAGHRPLVLQEALVLIRFFQQSPLLGVVVVEVILDLQTECLVVLVVEATLVELLETATHQPHRLMEAMAHLLPQDKETTEDLVALLHQITVAVVAAVQVQRVLLERVLLEVRGATEQLRQLVVLPRHTQVEVVVEQKMAAQVAQVAQVEAVQE